MIECPILDALVLPLMGCNLTGKLLGFEFETGQFAELPHELTELHCEHV